MMKTRFHRMRWLLKLCFLLALSGSVEAHRLDEYLQASLIRVSSEEISVQLNLTPGVDVSETVIRMIDSDRDGRITSAEGTAYAKAVVAQVSVWIDGRPLKPKLLRNKFDPIHDLRAGTGNIRIEMRARLGQMRAGDHLLSFENRHKPEISVYLVNAVLPKDRGIQIGKQERNENQSIGRIHFSVASGKSVTSARRKPLRL